MEIHWSEGVETLNEVFQRRWPNTFMKSSNGKALRSHCDSVLSTGPDSSGLMGAVVE